VVDCILALAESALSTAASNSSAVQQQQQQASAALLAVLLARSLMVLTDATQAAAEAAGMSKIQLYVR
jgi:hypothetical protein